MLCLQEPGLLMPLDGTQQRMPARLTGLFRAITIG